MLFLASVAFAEPLPGDVIPHRKTEQFMQLHAQLRPMGFSPDGKLGMLYIAPDEAVGCMQWSFVVHDLVTDKVVDQLGWSHDTCDDTLDTMWAREEPNVLKLFEKHGVVRSDVAFQRFTTGFDAWLITGSLHLPENPDELKVPVTVMLSADGLGEKTIGTLHVATLHDLPMTWGHEVLGYLQSPYEPRVAVLVREIHRGWEGLPTVEQVHVMGASLEKGF